MRFIRFIFSLTLVFIFSYCGNTVSRENLLAGKFSSGSGSSPTLISPRPGAYIISNDLQITFIWEYAEAALTYSIEIYSDAQYSSLVTRQMGITEGTATVKLDEHGSYYFKLFAANFPEVTVSGVLHILKDGVLVHCPSTITSCEIGQGFGTRNQPYHTLQDAVRKAAELNIPVHVAARGNDAVYRESVLISSPVTIKGSFNSQDWTRESGLETIFTANGAPALKIIASAGSEIRDLTFRNLSGTNDSTGIQILGAGPITVTDSKLEATADSGNAYALTSENSIVTLDNVQVSSTRRGLKISDTSGSTKKFAIKNCTIETTQQSILSSLANMEIENSTISSGSSSAIADTASGLNLSDSTFTGTPFALNTDTGLAKDLTMKGNTLNGSLRIDGGLLNLNIENNLIKTVNMATAAVSIGSSSSGAYSGKIHANKIQGGNTSISFSYVSNSSLQFYNNYIVSSGTATNVYGIYLFEASIAIENNTVYVTGSNSTHGIFNGSATGTNEVRNNIISTPASSNHYCITEGSASAEYSVILNNNLFGCPVFYRDENSTDRTAIADLNSSTNTTQAGAATSSGNFSIDNVSGQLFTDFNGPDGDPLQISDNDWSLRPAAGSICNVVFGGLNITARFTVDRTGTTRTAVTSGLPCSLTSPSNTAGEGWSIGAFERNN